MLEIENPETIVLQAGSIEISNIDVKKAMMDTEKDIDTYNKEWALKVENDSKNLFDIAEKAVKDNPKLKVIIVKRLPRFDSYSIDPLGVRSELTKFANKSYDQLWFRRGGPKNIHIVSFEFDCEKSNYLKYILFGNPDSKYYDGTHFRGPGSVRQFTYRAVQAIKPVFSSRHAPAAGATQSDSTNPQAANHRQSEQNLRDGNTNQFRFPRRFKRVFDNEENRGYETHRYGTTQYSIPVQNRFSENY